jgi:alkylated DNA repair dioxygenase AlkB
MVSLQGSLADSSCEVALAPLKGSVTRVSLSRGAWFDVRENWVTGSDALFDWLVHAVPWRSEERWMYDRMVDVPRLVSHFGVSETLPHPLLHQARSVLAEFYEDEPGSDLATASLCLYRDGHDSVAWHGDRIGRGATEDITVAIVSLGAPRRLLLRPRGGGASIPIDLGRGDLFVMGGSCQRTWEHAIPKAARTAGSRISVQFRPPNAR